MPPSRHRFYFDFISPFAYLAWSQLERIETECDVQFELIPVLFAGLLKAHGQLGPAEIPAKARWVYRHAARQAARHGIEMRPPAFHPFNPLLALRVAGLPMPLEDRDRMIDGLFRAVWAQGLHLAEPEVVSAVATDCGLDGQLIMDAAVSPENKDRLRRHTDQAIDDGIFGVPAFLVDDQVFWGFDDLENLANYLRGDDPLDNEWDDWSPTPSSTRR